MSETTNTISLETAEGWAAKWRKEEGKYNEHYKLHAFLIPKSDMADLLTEGVDAVRGYLGVDENNVEKMMFVGTKYDPDTKTYVDMIPGADVPGHIYDFTRPCPPACDPSSPLN